MDPVTLATITSAVTILATEVAKGAASEAGKQAWTAAKKLLGFSSDPSEAQLAPEIARRLAGNADAAKQIVTLLQEEPTGCPSSLVGSINAEKVVVADQINIAGDLNM